MERYQGVKFRYQQLSPTFFTEGSNAPSSESFLHNTLCHHLPQIHAIFHGHSTQLNRYAETLGIATTDSFHDYGTAELADSALRLAQSDIDFFTLRDHDFITLAKDIQSAGKKTLGHYSRLLELLADGCCCTPIFSHGHTHF